MDHHILLVEDEPTLQRILGSVLTDAGYTVRAVSSAEDAAVVIERAEPDLILCDKNLPGESGLDLLSRVREHIAAPFVLVTGYPSRQSALSVLAHGGDGYLVKPFRSLSRAVEQIGAYAKRRRGPARCLARDIRMCLHDETEAALADITIDIDDAILAERVTRKLGATAGSAAIVTSSMARLEEFAAHHQDAALVLVGAGTSFDDIVRLIDLGGAAIVDPTRMPV